MKPKKIFLIGGMDLEMKTILELLSNIGSDIKIINKNLSWGASVLNYKDELDEKYLEQYGECTIYGIELAETKDFNLPYNYIRIDHHNDFSHKPSSLEQVAKIIGIELTEYQKMVAINDIGHIKAMEEAGASQILIDKIRLADRQAQGVTQEEEEEAKRIREYHKFKNENLIVIPTTIEHFSPIIDNLYPFNNLLIYNNQEFFFTGIAKQNVVKFLKYNEDTKDKYFSGGGDLSGYVGIGKGVLNSTKIKILINDLSNNLIWKPISQHIFYFPFIWKTKDTDNDILSKQTSFSNLPKPSISSDWETDCELSIEEKTELYNEKNYYYPFVHRVLYDTGKEDSIIRHLERREPKHSKITYEIRINKSDKELLYTLKIDSINLNFHSTGVGILSIYLVNENHTSPEDILNINQYGRRIFPPFYKDIENRNEIAKSIAIKGLSGTESRYYEDFNSYSPNDTWKPALFITSLINDYCSELLITPVVDDRMFVNCWYGNTNLSNQMKYSDSKIELNDNKSKEDEILRRFMNGNFWYRYVYIDSDSETCQNDKMKAELVKFSTYNRWQKVGTLYGASHYSFVLLTDSGSFSREVFAKHMYGIYSRMVELVQIQKASTLRFSDEVSKVSHLESKSATLGLYISSLYKEYIRFINQVSFREVTDQNQGTELYNLMLEQTNSKAQIKNLDDEIEELHNYVSLLTEAKRNQNGLKLNYIAVIFLPASFIASLFGMNNISYFYGCKSFESLIQIMIIIAFTIIACCVYKLLEKKRK